MNKNTFLIAILALLNICCTNSQEHNTDYYEQIFSLKNIEYEKIESFIILFIVSIPSLSLDLLLFMTGQCGWKA